MYTSVSQSIKFLKVLVQFLNLLDQTTVGLSLRFSAVKEKLARERLRLVDTELASGISLDLEVVARVLGKGKGTPMLRDGVKCVDTLSHLDTDTEASDWQGF